MFTEKQSKDFVEWYLDRYNMKAGDPLPVVSKEKEAEEEDARKEKIAEILGKEAKKTYKQRSWGKETKENKAFNSLWLNYSPVFK